MDTDWTILAIIDTDIVLLEGFNKIYKVVLYDTAQDSSEVLSVGYSLSEVMYRAWRQL